MLMNVRKTRQPEYAEDKKGTRHEHCLKLNYQEATKWF